jgi:hypothetical protein
MDTADSPQIKGLNATVQGSLSTFWEEKQAFGKFDKGFSPLSTFRRTEKIQTEKRKVDLLTN